jgi:hypothetical protein
MALGFIVLLMLDERLIIAGLRRFWLKQLKDFFFILFNWIDGGLRGGLPRATPVTCKSAIESATSDGDSLVRRGTCWRLKIEFEIKISVKNRN